MKMCAGLVAASCREFCLCVTWRSCVWQAQQAQEKGGISLQYRISRGMPGTTGGGAVPPRLDHFSFTPVETPHGLFRMSVDFAPSSTVTILKETTSPGPVAQVLPAIHPSAGCISDIITALEWQMLVVLAMQMHLLSHVLVQGQLICARWYSGEHHNNSKDIVCPAADRIWIERAFCQHADNPGLCQQRQCSAARSGDGDVYACRPRR